MSTKLEGIIAVTVTPFRSDGSLDLESLPQVLQPLSGGVVDGAVINGNTGEYYALSHEEHLTLLGEAIDVLRGETTMIAAVGLDLPTALTEARKAADLGYDGVMVHHPVNPYFSNSGWISYHEEIAKAVPDLVVFPYVKAERISGEVIADLHERCPNVAGVKYAVPNPLRFARAVEEADTNEIAWFCGLAESWAPAFAAFGAVGFTSGLVNVDGSLPRALFEALREGDLVSVRRNWAAARPFEAMRSRYNDGNNVSVIKEALHQMGRCDRTVRAPGNILSAAERTEVQKLLEDFNALAAV